VSIDESDEATLMLLEALVSGSSVGETVEMVNAELGLGEKDRVPSSRGARAHVA